MVEMSFQISYVAVLNSSIPKYDLYIEKVFTDTHLKWGHSVSPEPDWLVPLRRGNLNRCGEDWWGSSTNQQRMLCEKKDPSTSLEDARYTFPPPQAQEETKDVDTLILRFQLLELGDNTSLLLFTPLLYMGLWFGQTLADQTNQLTWPKWQWTHETDLVLSPGCNKGSLIKWKKLIVSL